MKEYIIECPTCKSTFNCTKEIEKFKIELPGMKDYNSSDIVFKVGDKFYGASLKKKQTSNAPSPTMLNNAFGKALTPLSASGGEDARIISELLQDLEKSKQEFWNFVINDLHEKHHGQNKNLDDIIRHKESDGNEKKYKKDLKVLDAFVNDKNFKSTDDKWRKIIDSFHTTLLAPYLTSNKSILKEIDTIITKYQSSLAPLLIDVILKLKIYDLREQNFDFALIEGVGQQLKTKGFVVEPANVIGLPALYEKMVQLNITKPNIVKRKGKIQAYEEGSTAAKLFYTVMYGGTEVVYLELRYKGSYTADPQFFAVLADSFKHYLVDQKGGDDKVGSDNKPELEKTLVQSRPTTEDKQVEKQIETKEEYKEFIRSDAVDEDIMMYDKGGKAIGIRNDYSTQYKKDLEGSGMSQAEIKSKTIIGDEIEF